MEVSGKTSKNVVEHQLKISPLIYLKLCKRNDAILSQCVLIDKESVILEIIKNLLRWFMAGHYGHHIQGVHGPNAARLAAPCSCVIPDFGGSYGSGEAP